LPIVILITVVIARGYAIMIFLNGCAARSTHATYSRRYRKNEKRGGI